MDPRNLIEFDVREIGHFKAYKEAPARTFFLQEREQLARLVGGLTELTKMESTARALKDSPDPIEKEQATALQWELFGARAYLELKNLLVEYPAGVTLESLDSDAMLEVYFALQKARGNFPGRNQQTSDKVNPTGQAGNASAKDQVPGVPETGQAV